MPPAFMQYERRLASWVNLAADARQRNVRQFAANETEDWYKQRLVDHRWNEDLVLYALGLSEIPPLPEGVRHVDLSRNQIARLSGLQALPKSLLHLKLAGNPLKSFALKAVVTRNPATIVELGIAQPAPTARQSPDRVAPDVAHAQTEAGLAPSPHGAARSASSSRASRETLREKLVGWVQQADDGEVMARLRATDHRGLAELQPARHRCFRGYSGKRGRRAIAGAQQSCGIGINFAASLPGRRAKHRFQWQQADGTERIACFNSAKASRTFRLPPTKPVTSGT